jgi:MYXO-CTERM domain-containing protein
MSLRRAVSSIHALSAPWVGAVAILLSCSLFARPARAHGRFPQTGLIAFHPTDPSTILVRATFGLLVTHDDGETWRYVCLEALGARATEDPKVLLASDGAIVAAVFDGLSLGTDDGCAWVFPTPALTETVVIDAVRGSDTASSFFALTSNGSGDNGLYRSADDGRSFTATNAAIDPILFETVRVAPSDPMRIYLSGAYPPSATEPRRPFIYRSLDGGATFESFAFTDFGTGDRNVYLLGVDPRDPARLLAHVRSDATDRVLESTDGGETFSPLLEVNDVDAFAWSDDGNTVYVGGRIETGLYRSDDGGETFANVRSDVSIGCASLRGTELFVCAENYDDGFAIGKSTDMGATFETILAFSEITGPVECTAGSTTPMVCATAFADLVRDLGLDIDAGVPPSDAGILDGGVSLDGGVEPPDPGGCSCAVAGFFGSTEKDTPIAIAVALFGLGAARARRRRRL